MVKPIEHGAASTVSTAAWETAKGGIAGILLFAVIGAAAAVGVGALGGAIVGALLPGVTAAGAATFMATGVPLAITGTLGALAGVFEGGMIGGIAGAVLGLFRGGKRVSAESQAYQKKMERRGHTHEITQNNAAMAGMQQGYMAGFQEGRQHVIAQLQQAQEQMLTAQTAKAEAPVEGKFTAHCETKCKSHAEAVTKGREAAAVASPQVG